MIEKIKHNIVAKRELLSMSNFFFCSHIFKSRLLQMWEGVKKPQFPRLLSSSSLINTYKQINTHRYNAFETFNLPSFVQIIYLLLLYIM